MFPEPPTQTLAQPLALPGLYNGVLAERFREAEIATAGAGFGLVGRVHAQCHLVYGIHFVSLFDLRWLRHRPLPEGILDWVVLAENRVAGHIAKQSTL